MKHTVNNTLNEYKLKKSDTISEEIAVNLSEVSKQLADLGNRLNADLLKYGRKSNNNVDK